MDTQAVPDESDWIRYFWFGHFTVYGKKKKKKSSVKKNENK